MSGLELGRESVSSRVPRAVVLSKALTEAPTLIVCELDEESTRDDQEIRRRRRRRRRLMPTHPRQISPSPLHFLTTTTGGTPPPAPPSAPVLNVRIAKHACLPACSPCPVAGVFLLIPGIRTRGFRTAFADQPCSTSVDASSLSGRYTLDLSTSTPTPLLGPLPPPLHLSRHASCHVDGYCER